MGEEATRLTGYPAISIFHDFKYDPKMVIRGGDVDWVYDFLGVFAWVTEFWSPQRAAGLADYHFIDWIRDHPPEDDLALLKLADELGEGYVDWYPFEHPQLGPVELGGWDLVRFWFNPPLSRLEEEVDAARGLRALPRARLAAARGAVVRVRRRSATARTGSGSSSRTPAGCRRTSRRRRSTGRPCGRSRSSSSCRTGARVVTGQEREEAGQLAGASSAAPSCGGASTTRRATARRSSGSSRRRPARTVGVVARHERAGTARAELTV